MPGIILAAIALIGAALVLLALSRRKKKNTLPKGEVQADEKKPLIGSIQNAIKGFIETALSRELSYEEAIKYFIAHKKDKSEYVKGALLKEKAGDGFIITQVFLDGNNGVVDGRRIKVTGLDKELLDAFKDEDLLIVE
jgi:hypothetical protein